MLIQCWFSMNFSRLISHPAPTDQKLPQRFREQSKKRRDGKIQMRNIFRHSHIVRGIANLPLRILRIASLIWLEMALFSSGIFGLYTFSR